MTATPLRSFGSDSLAAMEKIEANRTPRVRTIPQIVGPKPSQRAAYGTTSVSIRRYGLRLPNGFLRARRAHTIAPIVCPDNPRRFTDSGMKIDAFYGEADVPKYLDFGLPCDFPYTRGVHEQMYSSLDGEAVRRLRQHKGIKRALPLPALSRAMAPSFRLSSNC